MVLFYFDMIGYLIIEFILELDNYIKVMIHNYNF
jgi:hypothetical protein